MSDLTSVREHLLLVIEDAERDALALDGQPFSGRTMAENFGYAYAQIQALGKMLLAMVDALEDSQ
jgi:hypothetical protein